MNPYKRLHFLLLVVHTATMTSAVCCPDWLVVQETLEAHICLDGIDHGHRHACGLNCTIEDFCDCISCTESTKEKCFRKCVAIAGSVVTPNWEVQCQYACSHNRK